MGHKRRREHTASKFNKYANSQKRQFMKIQLCKKMRTDFDANCSYNGHMYGYDPKDRTKTKNSKLKSKYRQYDIDTKSIKLII